MGTVIEVQDGEASMGVYLVKYDEYQWFRYDEAGHQYCYDTWIKKAKPLGVRHVVLQLIPDALFPMHPDKPLPYTYWQHKIVPEHEVGFKLHYAKVSIEVEKPDIDVPLRHKIETALREYPNGTRYKVWCEGEHGNITILLEGKVEK